MLSKTLSSGHDRTILIVSSWELWLTRPAQNQTTNGPARSGKMIMSPHTYPRIYGELAASGGGRERRFYFKVCFLADWLLSGDLSHPREYMSNTD